MKRKLEQLQDQAAGRVCVYFSEAVDFPLREKVVQYREMEIAVAGFFDDLWHIVRVHFHSDIPFF